MIKVDNRKTIQKIAKTSFLADRMRNIFAVIAITLTTILFTGLFTIGSSIAESMQAGMMRQVGGSSHASFKYLNQEQYEILSQHELIKDISYSVVLGIAENEEFKTRQSELRFAHDEKMAEWFFAKPTTGRMPQADDEIALDTICLEKLGLKEELGQLVTLEYSVGGEKYTDTFTLVGYWEGDILIPASQIWLARSFVEQRLEGYKPENGENIIGSINAEVMFHNSYSIEKKMLRVITGSGFSTDEIDFGINWAYTGAGYTPDMSMLLAIAALLLMVGACGYLIISNIFSIGIAKDIRYYGLLKTIGTTAGQIRSIIQKQAFWLCIIAVPLGIISGLVVSVWMTPIILSTLNVTVITVSVNGIVFAGSAFFSMLTVFASIKRPSKMAERISPMEALHVSDGAQTTKKMTKKSCGVKMHQMAAGNVFRNKKKAVFLVVSMSLSLIILNMTYSIANSFDMDKFLSGMIRSDFVLADAAYFLADYENQETLSKELLGRLEQTDGVEDVGNIYFSEEIAPVDDKLSQLPEQAETILGESGSWISHMKEEVESGWIIQHIYGLDDMAWSKLELLDGKIDLEKLKTGNYVVVSAYDEEGELTYYQVGDMVQIYDADGNAKEYEVLAVANVPFCISVQHRHPITPEYFLSGEVFLEDIEEKEPMLTMLETAEDAAEKIEKMLHDYIENENLGLHFKSKATIAEEYENTQKMYRTVGIVLSTILAMIGIVNFANTMITSVMSRKTEFAMLQSIGMTKKQLVKMLMSEGMIYMMLAAAIALTLGSAAGYVCVKALFAESPYVTLEFTVLPTIVCIPVLIIIALLIPYLSQMMICKKSIVERLRECP